MEFSKKADRITQEQIESFGILDQEDRIVYGINHNLSSNLNEIPIKATQDRRKKHNCYGETTGENSKI